MKLAVIKTGGKQYLVKEGQKIKVEKLDRKEGETFDFPEVLLLAEGESVEVGLPNLSKKVTAKVLKEGRGPKVRVIKFKRKVRYDKVYGHRQPFTEVQIEKIG